MRVNFPWYFFNVVSVGGATASGLENPNSITQAFSIFKTNLENSKAKIVIVLLGEVDTGFVIWYRSEKYNTKVEEMLDKALKNYQDFLLFLSKRYQVICLSTPLPTIKDGQNHGQVANLRKDIKASQRDKTQLTIQFNKSMKRFCFQKKLHI
ncbi:SGNH/GDSL hydrolase family protein [Picosynechococcus sp. NKBG15041c]|uniref:SGNH/GDSL hydrolase family protein n=1 Tax=Picosynechococcus sp. NKBG15041c TaxID=1407650 RepID=UPI00191C0A6E|nr:SGNH/GDSL hydrolase family protein [Picosynechococcus sp. NKBG15041c]